MRVAHAALALFVLVAAAACGGSASGAAGAAEPTFDWGSPGSCAAGSGSFRRSVPHTHYMVVGRVPAGKTGVNVTLKSQQDADVQLVEAATGAQIVSFPDGLLSGPRKACHNVGSMRVCWSGYNGLEHADGQQYKATLGYEWITIDGTTDRELEMRAFGYAKAETEVHYSWAADAVCCRAGGHGRFDHTVRKDAEVELGRIPAGVENVAVRLESKADLDVRLTDESNGRVVVGWPKGLLKANVTGCAEYEGLRYCYSGYNGGGWKGTEGNEWINVTGVTNRPLKMTVFGYKAGKSLVVYSSSRPSACEPGKSAGGSGPDGDLLAAGRTLGFDHDAHAKAHGEDGARWAAAFNRPGAAGAPARVAVRRGGSIYLRATGKDLVQRLKGATFELGGQKFARAGAYWAAPPKVAPGGASATVELGVPHTAAIGLLSLRVSVPGFGPKRHELGRVAVLFNPWHKDDGVYLADEEKRAEYVRRGDGRAWHGSVSETGSMNVNSLAWNFHQYELLERVLAFLGRVEGAPGFRTERWWNDPARVAREVTRLTPQKLLRGRWDGQYADGRAPTYWTNSREIFDAAEAAGGPAQYGQCWVFALLTRTLCSSVGIPARVVTNFQSAHDTRHPSDFVAEVGGGADSVWNFHVWNDVWIRRGKVPQWNAIDSTPQELSEGSYQCGPAPLEAVRGAAKDAALARWDADFVRAEVQSLWWDAAASAAGPYTAERAAARPCLDYATGCSHSLVGQHISTLRPGCSQDGNACRDDVTAEYKPGWKPLSERAAASFLEADAALAGGLAASVSPAAPGLGDNVTLSVTVSAEARRRGGRVSLRAVVVYEDGTVGNLPAGDCPCCAGAAPAPRCSCSTDQQTKGFCAAAAGAEKHCCCEASARGAHPFDVRPVRTDRLAPAAPAASLLEAGAAKAAGPAGGLATGEVEHGRAVDGEALASAVHELAPSPNATAPLLLELAVSAHMYARYMWKTSTVRFVALLEPAANATGAGANATGAGANATGAGANATAPHAVTRQVTLRPPEMAAVPSCAAPVPGRPFYLTLSFVNRLPIDLTGLVVTTDGPTPSSDQVLRFPGGVARAGQRAVMQTKPMVLDEPGVHNLVLSVESCQYHGLFGSATVRVGASEGRLTDPESVCADRVPTFPAPSQ